MRDGQQAGFMETRAELGWTVHPFPFQFHLHQRKVDVKVRDKDESYVRHRNQGA